MTVTVMEVGQVGMLVRHSRVGVKMSVPRRANGIVLVMAVIV